MFPRLRSRNPPLFSLLLPSLPTSTQNLLLSMFSSMLPSSESATRLESLICSPASPPGAVSVAGRLSYPPALPLSFPSPNSPESDISLQSPRALSQLSNVRITYSELVASSQAFVWPSTSKLGAGPRVPVQRQSVGEQSSSECRIANARLTARRNLSSGPYAPISQVLSSPLLPFEVCDPFHHRRFLCSQRHHSPTPARASRFVHASLPRRRPAFH
ncbi:hypothetical protein DFH07DRAFT_802827 [Mycena maculata]|uniref:Uncharacterized protein n=1 Tax=Mycena maculata TaxID=230809 RepID=A0AAD7JXZ7_9AGAR|nr:hypothetical protein DFH07DRAFT_802827 [Mycena maculata]